MPSLSPVDDDGGGRRSAVVDVAGLPVVIDAPTPALATIARAAVAGFPEVDGADRRGAVRMRVDRRVARRPDRAPDDEGGGFEYWVGPDGPTVATGSAIVQVVGDRVTAHVPDPADDAGAEGLVAVALAWVLAGHGRFVVHAGAIAWGPDAYLVPGPSGAGKSTLAAVAMEHGWRVLADDLVVVTSDRASLRVHGLHRAPAVPGEIGGPVVATGVPIGDPRARVALTSEVLDAMAGTLVGTIVVGHADGPQTTVSPLPAARVVPRLLASFGANADPARRAAFFSVARRVGELPAWSLAHGADPGARRDGAAAALRRVRLRSG